MFFVVTERIRKYINDIDVISIDKFLKKMTYEYKKETLLEKPYLDLMENVSRKNYTSKKYKFLNSSTKKLNFSIDKQIILNTVNTRGFIINNSDCYIDEDLVFQIYYRLIDGIGEQKFGYRKLNTKKYRSTHPDFIVNYNNIETMMNDLFLFINDYSDYRVHPYIKVIITNYYIRYVSPVEFANDYLAFSISYLMLLKERLHSIRNNPLLYFYYKHRSHLDLSYITSVNHNNDLTYAITGFLNTLQLQQAFAYNKLKSITLIEAFMNRLVTQKYHVNERQEEIIKEMAIHNKNFIEIDYYKKRFSVVQETARKDLVALAEMGILIIEQVGKKYIYKLNINMT
jgi:Fic family protein